LTKYQGLVDLAHSYGIECQINKIPLMPIQRKTYYHEFHKSSSLWPMLGLSGIDCVGGNLVCGVKSNGTVSPCGFANLPYGQDRANSLIHNSLAWLWRNSTNLKALRAIPPNDECGACPQLTLCGGGCRATAHSQSGVLGDIDPLCVINDTPEAIKEAWSREISKVPAFVQKQHEDRFYISDEVLVTKCGWATYS
jgi:radical SAM protein with 4Fe4S-binding SPASM domain